MGAAQLEVEQVCAASELWPPRPLATMDVDHAFGTVRWPDALETILRLTLEAALTNAQIAEVEKAAPNSPQAGSLRQRVVALEGQVRKERERLAGDDASLAPLIAEYERLMLERELAEKTFASALTLLEAARADSQRQGLFLERISSPIPPDHPRYPYGLLGILATLAVTSIVYSIGRNLISDTMMHA